LKVDIPSEKQPAPNGLLDQLAWGATGGDPDSFRKPCGNCSITRVGSNLVLRGFNSHQGVRLAFYRSTGGNDCATGTGDYLASTTTQVDGSGNQDIIMNGSLNDMVIFAFDEATNEELWRDVPYDNTYLSCPSAPSNSCPGAPPQRLTVNYGAYVCTSSGNVILRTGPGKSYPEIISFPPGTNLTVTGGPQCADNWSWWQVTMDSGQAGWMTEGGDNIDPYFLCPIN